MTTSLFIARALFALAGLVLLLAPLPAHGAQGVMIAWDECFGDANATQNMSFACDTNAGFRAIKGSFRLAEPMSIVIGVEMVVEITVADAVLPAWWRYFYSGSCRSTSLVMQTFPDPSDTVCPDWADGLSVGGIGGYCVMNAVAGCSIPGPANRASLRMITAVPPADARELLGEQDYFAFGLRIDHAKTVGTGACPGCSTPACLVLSTINVVARDNVEQRTLTGAAFPGSNIITWQGGAGTGCPAVTSAKRSTWGAVKSLYR